MPVICHGPVSHLLTHTTILDFFDEIGLKVKDLAVCRHEIHHPYGAGINQVPAPLRSDFPSD